MSIEDYYQVLGINRDASQEEVKRAFRSLALRYHPDHNPHDQKQAEERFKEINEAYEALNDEDKRRRYDYLTTWPRYRQRVIVLEDTFDDEFTEGLGREALQQLLKQLAALGLSFSDVTGCSRRGCGRAYGRRCRRFRRWPYYS
ncbi:MAG: J domain-containing protein [Dehalococcoidia bacterium]|nr:MAG: J domain-containing protein [Dehalococcoidia bacterium]